MSNILGHVNYRVCCLCDKRIGTNYKPIDMDALARTNNWKKLDDFWFCPKEDTQAVKRLLAEREK